MQLEKIIKFKPIDILTRKRDITLQPLDEIIFYPKFDFKPIEITGEVKKPVEIPYREGITLLEVLSGINFTKDVKSLKVIVYRYKLNNINKQGTKMNQSATIRIKYLSAIGIRCDQLQ